MATSSTQRAQALKLLGARSMMRLKDFAAHGIGPETLARLVREGIVVRAARGLYQLVDGSVDARRVLAESAVLVPKGVICLVSALQFHGLTLQMPRACGWRSSAPLGALGSTIRRSGLCASRARH